MTVSMAVRSGRRAAEKLMVDNCRITRTGEPTIGPDGREHISETTVYEGKCKVQTYEPYEQTPNTAGHTAVVQRYSVHAPYGAGPFEVGDKVTVTGREFRVAGLHEKTYQTAIRLLVDEVVI